MHSHNYVTLQPCRCTLGEVGTDGRVVNEQAKKPLEVKDKYVTNVFRAAKVTANRGDNMTGRGKLKNKFCININTI